MNEVMQVRAASWTSMIKQRNDSSLTIKDGVLPTDLCNGCLSGILFHCGGMVYLTISGCWSHYPRSMIIR